MVGKKRTYKPYSKEKLAMSVYNLASARMGVYGTESVVLQLAVYNYAQAVAQRWDEVGSWAATTYNNIMKRYELAGLQRAAVRALVGVAAKWVQKMKRGVPVTADQVRADINAKLQNLGVDVPGSVVDDIVQSVVGTTA